MTTIERYDQLTNEYIRSAKRKNLSNTTITNYESVLRLFRDFVCEHNANGEYVDYSDITSYMEYLEGNGVKPTSVKQRLVTLNQFFTFATKPYISADLRYDHSPVSKDFYPKTPNTPIGEIIPDYALPKLWENRCLYKLGSHYFPRNYAITVLILATGLRNKEVAELTLQDVSFEFNEITVRHGKGDKYRIVDAPDIVISAILLYLHSGLRPSGISDAEPLFGSTAAHEKLGARFGEKWHSLSGQEISSIIERHVYNQVGFRGCRSHDLRHLFARISLNATGNLTELQGLMGHSSPSTTMRYSERLRNHRKRVEYQNVLAARDEAAKENFAMLEKLEQSRKVKICREA